MKKIFLLFNLFVSLSCFAQVPSYVSTNGIVGYWPFDGNANDVSGNGNNGVNNGGVSTTDRFSVANAAYYFSAAGCATYIQTNINTAAINTSGAMTLSFWIYRVGNGCMGGSARVMEFGSCPNCAGQILVSWGDGVNPIIVRHYVTATSFITYSFNGVSSNNWYHIVYTNDGTNAKFYINGALVNTTASPAVAQLLGNTAFGRMNHTAYDAFNGNLDDIGLWSRALTSCEIQELYQASTSPAFVINPLQDTTLICDSTTLDAGAGYTNYLWSTGAAAQTISAKTEGNYKVTVTNSSGCVASDSTYIKSIKANITQDDTTVCKGSNISLTAFAGNGSGGSSTLLETFVMDVTAPYAHTLNTPLGFNYYMTATGQMADHCDAFNTADAAFYINRLPQNSNPYMKWLFDGGFIRPDGNSYSATNNYTYTLSPAATHSLTFTDNPYTDNCGSITFQLYRIDPPNTNTYTWSANPSATGGLNPADIHNQTISVTPTDSTIYHVTISNGITSCEDSVKILIAKLDTSVTSSDPLSICASGGIVHLHAGAAASYQWLLNGAVIPTATSKDYNATQTGAYRVIVFNAAGCSDTSRALTINIYPQPVAGFTIATPTAQCLSSNSFSFTNTSTVSSGILFYKWSFGDGNTTVTTDATHSYTVANPSYTVQLIDSSNNGCMDTTHQNVIVNGPDATPIVTPNGTVSICTGGNIVLTSSAATGNQWYKNGAIIPAEINKTYTATTAGVYNVISTNTCASDSSNDVTVTVTLVPPTPTITTSGSLVICGTGSVVLSSSAATGNSWYLNNAPIAGAANQNYTATVAGNYHVIASVSSCLSNPSDDTTVTIVPLPVKPTITATGTTALCAGGTVLLTSSSVSDNQWFLNAAPVSGAVNNTYTASSAGSYTVGVTNVCAGDVSVPTIVTINPPTPGIRYNSINVEVGTSFPLQARTFGDTYLWSPGTGLSDNTISNPTTANFTATQSYLIQIKTNANCITYDTLLVKAFGVKGLLVPTAFSPNNDGRNDKLTITLINIQQLTYFKIFNRWGQVVFQTTNSGTGWDGNYQGVPQGVGNYIWAAEGIDENGKTVDDHGSVMIVR